MIIAYQRRILIILPFSVASFGFFENLHVIWYFNVELYVIIPCSAWAHIHVFISFM